MSRAFARFQIRRSNSSLIRSHPRRSSTSPAGSAARLGARYAGHGHPQRHARLVRRRRRATAIRRAPSTRRCAWGRRRRHHRRRRRVDAARRRARRRGRGAARVLPVVERAGAADSASRSPSTPTRPTSRASRARRRRGDRQRRQRAAAAIRRWRASWPAAGAALILMHTRGRSNDDVRRGPVRRRGRRGDATSCAAASARRPPAGVPRERDHRRPGHRVCQTAGAQLWCAGAAARARARRSTARCSSGRRASRSCATRSAAGRRPSATGARRRR